MVGIDPGCVKTYISVKIGHDRRNERSRSQEHDVS